MDERRFDAIMRSIGGSRTRRGMLRVVAGAAIGGLSGRPLVDAAAAAKPANAVCSSDSQCASGVCIKYAGCKKKGRLTGKCRCGCAGGDCPTGSSCRNGACFGDCSAPTTCVPDAPEICNRKKGCPCWSTDAAPSCISPVAADCGGGCDTSADCPVGQVCMDLGTCADLAPQCAAKFCINPCGLGGTAPSTSAAVGSSRQQRRSHGSARVDLGNLGG